MRAPTFLRWVHPLAWGRAVLCLKSAMKFCATRTQLLGAFLVFHGHERAGGVGKFLPG